MIRPMLAATIDPLVDKEVFKKLRFPMLGSPKLDGIRALADKSLYSRSGKLLPSNQAQTMFGHLIGLDGELIIGNPTDVNVYNTTQSHIMSVNKPALIVHKDPLEITKNYTPKTAIANISYHLFDRWQYQGEDIKKMLYYRRLELLPKDLYLKPVPHIQIGDLDGLLQFENKCLTEGYEGIMLNDPYGVYKEGRSTFNEGYLYKLKRFSEFETEVVALEEQYTNMNEKVRDELGYAERSTKMANLLPANTLGNLIVKYGKDVISVGCGCMTHAERKMYWDDPSKIIMKTIVVRHFQVGLDGYMPRFPRFVGFREDGR